MTPEEAWKLVQEAEELVGEKQVQAAVIRLAREITVDFSKSFPLILCVMNGGIVVTGHLLPKLLFPLTLGYVHATRYQEGTEGGNIQWLAPPPGEVAGREVLVVDDILDEGDTLWAIVERCRAMGAKRVASCVLAEKILKHPKRIKADFTGLALPERYVFGFGMDAYGLWRNLPRLMALEEKARG